MTVAGRVGVGVVVPPARPTARREVSMAIADVRLSAIDAELSEASRRRDLEDTERYAECDTLLDRRLQVMHD